MPTKHELIRELSTLPVTKYYRQNVKAAGEMLLGYFENGKASDCIKGLLMLPYSASLSDYQDAASDVVSACISAWI